MAARNSSGFKNPQHHWKNVFVLVVLILTLVIGGYLRLVGVNWDENQHMHPDERFLSLVQVAISPVENLSEYFDTATSSLNPENRGYGFFVYGTAPIFLIRYLGELLGQTDYHTITILGRYVSAIFDVITILLVYAIGKRLFNRWVGVLAALFYSLSVLPIQLSHYMTVDTITNTFGFLAVYASVWVVTRNQKPINRKASSGSGQNESVSAHQNHDYSANQGDSFKLSRLLIELAPYVVFGVALGAATASKINAVVLALLLPLGEFIRLMRKDPEERSQAYLSIVRNLIIAAVISFIVFRIGQPYAFEGPGFFNFRINENWWQSLQSLRAQASGDVDFPPALQWARRPITFSLENLVVWGLGIPLGVVSWVSYLVMGWILIRKKQWESHIPLWIFTGLYFIWQSFSWVRSMRYQALIYPSLTLFAAWGLVQLWSNRDAWKLRWVTLKPKMIRVFGVVLTGIVILSTAAWAFAFSRIYTRPHTRVAASRWIYQNIPGALTLIIETGEGRFRQPLPYRSGDVIESGESYRLPFIAVADGTLNSITLPHILNQAPQGTLSILSLSVHTSEDLESVLGTSMVEGAFLPTEAEPIGSAYEFILDQPITVFEGDFYFLEFRLSQGESSLLLNGSPVLNIFTVDGMVVALPLPRFQQSVHMNAPYTMSVQVVETGLINDVEVAYLVDLSGIGGQQEINLSLENTSQSNLSATSTLREVFSPARDIRGKSVTFELLKPLAVEAGDTLQVTLTTPTEGARLVFHAPAPVHESSWDDAVPYPVDGFSPYSDSGGIYRGDLNFEMYWADDASKLKRFETNLDLADFIFITSSRQWGTTTRVPERYPLTTAYYRNLLGCPEESSIERCYSVAEPGMFSGTLGFDLVATFQSNPNLGSFEINSQFAEEAFTVYDHPKVLIFRKSEEYDPLKMRAILRSVDLNKAVYFTPGDAANYEGPDQDQLYEPRYNLMLPEDRLEQQRKGGTWSELFNRQSLINSSQPIAAAAFYLFVFLLGLISYPFIRLALPGLDDRGYPLSKLAGLLLLAFIVWILGSLGIPFSTLTISLVLLGILIIAIILIILQRKALWSEVKGNWRYYLIIEILSLIAFISFIFIRYGNPDLWHPYKGGEKPMDFSYLNAVLKSTTFPPFDPWFAGGYINYYYYGFVIVGVPIKLLGIVPAVAYNIVLPLWYSLLILGGFSVGWNLYCGIPRSKALQAVDNRQKPVFNMAFWTGLFTAVGLTVLGNLGTVRLIFNGWQQISAGTTALESASLGQKIGWTLQGFAQFLKGTPMPFYPGDWYWFPSRVIPGEPITEFPYFTFIYGDLHAHLIAFPITVLAISWSLSVILNKAKWGEEGGHLKWLSTGLGFFLGGIVIGALRPTNTWDFYTYIVLASVALLYSVLRHYQPKLKLSFRNGDLLEKIGVALGAILVLVFLAVFLYQPFAYWYGQGYTQVEVWEGSRTPLSSYLTHWGLFLFLITSWMAWETYHWMKTTPQSALKRLEPSMSKIYTALGLFLVTFVVFVALGVVVAVVVLPLGFWAVLLMLKPGQSDGRRFLLFLIGTAVTLTLVVELIYLPGDIGRMNTVFKFYLQAWILLALSSGVCLSWCIKSLRYWKPHLAVIWQALLFIIVTSAALFTLMGTADKIRDRMAPEAPNTLDGMAFMAYATYYDLGVEMDLSEDYRAIHWLQENVLGSPVILEGQAYEYRWGNRFTIYTGLPGVVGWNWHQRQQRSILRNNIVQERVDAVNTFYLTEEQDFVVDFIDKYDISYIVLGQLERIFYPGAGLEKFERYEGLLWKAVFQDSNTVIYKVLE